MLVFSVYGETLDRAQGVAQTLKTALTKSSAFIFFPQSLSPRRLNNSEGSPGVRQSRRTALYCGRGVVHPRTRRFSGSRRAPHSVIKSRARTAGFGYDETNPIPADGNWYRRRLRCPNGHPFWYHRLGSCGPGPDGHIVDRLHLLCFCMESEVSLYFDMYHKGHSSSIPEGLSCEDAPLGRGMTSGRLVGFPKGLQDG
jgi:hypothetical protein